MYIGVGILALVFIFISLIQTLWNWNWKLIYTAYGNEEYFKIIAILKTEGIKLKIETPYRGIDSRITRFKDNTQYDIYVKKDEEHLAVKALQKRNNL
ncbi:hypothetical protein ACFPA1_09280 [Neobacillus sp. GCM10023253]|uniref:hypothetical protein n=1 Tax=Neobacillus sp. GCM10023253 TaxID=3252644 RepID=UPI00361B8151